LPGNGVDGLGKGKDVGMGITQSVPGWAGITTLPWRCRLCGFWKKKESAGKRLFSHLTVSLPAFVMTEMLRTPRPSMNVIAKRVYKRIKQCREAHFRRKSNAPIQQRAIILRKRW